MFSNDKVTIEARLAILDKAIDLAEGEVNRQWEMWRALERPYDIHTDIKDAKKREARVKVLQDIAPLSGPTTARVLMIARDLETFVLK